MDKDTFILNNHIYSNNNNILFGIINDLQQIINYSHDNLTIKRISDIIIKMNFIINENKKNMELIMNQFSKLENKINQLLNQKSNINNHQELKFDFGRYVGQVVNGLAEGKGIYYFNNGDKHEGEWRNGNKEGKGIYYFNNGERYEGDFRNGNKEGKGITYFPNGDRRMGDFYNNMRKGKFVMLKRDGGVEIYNY